MYVGPFQISMETLIGVAPLLGDSFEDRSGIRERQDWGLVQWLQGRTSTRLRDESQQNLFCVAPLDIVATSADGRKRFHILELNGTGIGGLTNLTGQAVSAVLTDLRQFAAALSMSEPVVLVASSGMESEQQPRRNKLIHEKVLFAEALKRGFDHSGRPARVTTVTQLPPRGATVVVGYMKEFLAQLQRDDAGRLYLAGRHVQAAVNDRFCLNILHRFDRQVDLHEFRPMNRCFLAGADKGIAYQLLNDFLTRSPRPFMPGHVACERCHDREELLAAVLRWLQGGRKAVIKPQGTGLGDGIDFFLSAAEPAASVAARIDASLAATAQRYALTGGALPYTVCDFLEAAAIEQPGHPLQGHRYELRVVVYRDEMDLKAFPSIVKIASERYDAARPTRMSLVHNITASVQAKHQPGTDFMLPLANRGTLALIGVSLEELLDLCATATSFVRHVLDRVQDEPALLGLPSAEPAVQPH